MARNAPSARGGDQVQSLMRALALLNRIAESPDDGASLTDLAQQVGLPTSTAHRLLTTLEQERYVRFNHEQRTWTVGVQAFVTGSAFTKTRSLVALARAHMRRLMEEGGETVNLAVEDEGEAVYLAQVECRQMMRVFARPGSRVPLHCSAVGKAILSATSDKRLSKILHQRGMPRLTVKTITTPAASAAGARARARGRLRCRRRGTCRRAALHRGADLRRNRRRHRGRLRLGADGAQSSRNASQGLAHSSLRRRAPFPRRWGRRGDSLGKVPSVSTILPYPKRIAGQPARMRWK